MRIRICLGGYLNHYLALKILRPKEDYNALPFSEYRYIRNGITHETLLYDDRKDRIKMKDFLIGEFGSEQPDWDSEETANKLRSWVMKIRETLREIVFH